MSYKFGDKSWAELKGVDPRLVAVVSYALSITEQDFMVFDGLRTQAEQSEMVAIGASQTMFSKHLTGKAVDLVPYINGKPRWETEPCDVVAEAMIEASRKTGIQVRWGGCWDTYFVQNDLTPAPSRRERYIRRCLKTGSIPFIDAVHFELV